MTFVKIVAFCITQEYISANLLNKQTYLIQITKPIYICVPIQLKEEIMKNRLLQITLILFSLTITACSHYFYDLKNPNSRKQMFLFDIISADLYLQETNDYYFSYLKTGKRYDRYIGWTYYPCGLEKADTYTRSEMSIKEFREKVPKIITNLRGSRFYEEFKDYSNEKSLYKVSRLNVESMIKFIKKEQKNIKITKIADDYICVSIQY